MPKERHPTYKLMCNSLSSHLMIFTDPKYIIYQLTYHQITFLDYITIKQLMNLMKLSCLMVKSVKSFFSCKTPMFDVKIRRCSRWISRFSGSKPRVDSGGAFRLFRHLVLYLGTGDALPSLGFLASKMTNLAILFIPRDKYEPTIAKSQTLVLSHAILLISHAIPCYPSQNHK